MNATDEKYGSLIERLKASQPTLNNPEELTNDIMSSIKTSQSRSLGKVLVMARPWISIAAVLLIGLLIYQLTSLPETQPQAATIPIKKSDIKFDHCFSSFLSEGANKESFFASYFCYLKQSEQKSKNSNQIIMKFYNKL